MTASMTEEQADLIEVVLETMDKLEMRGKPINPFTIANEARLSRSAIYWNAELRQIIDLRRAQQDRESHRIAACLHKKEALMQTIRHLEQMNADLIKSRVVRWEEGFAAGLDDAERHAQGQISFGVHETQENRDIQDVGQIAEAAENSKPEPLPSVKVGPRMTTLQRMKTISMLVTKARAEAHASVSERLAKSQSQAQASQSSKSLQSPQASQHFYTSTGGSAAEARLQSTTAENHLPPR